MLAVAHTFAIDGGEVRHVSVEAEVRKGLPGLRLLGMPGATPGERIQSAIRNSGMQWPGRRIVVSVRPAPPRAAVPALELAIACAVLAAAGQLPRERLGRIALLGELGLDGSVHPVPGTFATADAARRRGMQALAVAPADAREAALADGLRVVPVRDLRAAAELLGGEQPEERPLPPPPPPDVTAPELADVRGQTVAVRALIVAAAGGHSLLLTGAPGVGKTMLATRLPGIVPPLDREEALEVAHLRSALGSPLATLEMDRPFRAPHHSISPGGLLGRARNGWCGELALAHRGALFLDELTLFGRPSLDALRRPLDEGAITVLRARSTLVRPARVILLCAANPCPCGLAEEGRCTCLPGELARHLRRMPAPLLDRIDMRVPLTGGAAVSGGAAAPSSASAREAVRAARERQLARLAGSGLRLNSELDAGSIGAHVRLGRRAQRRLDRERGAGSLGPRGEHAVLRVARTLADLDGRVPVRDTDVAEALALRLGRPP